MERPEVGSPEEPVFFHAASGTYTGHLPAFYPAGSIPAATVLAGHVDDIRSEVLAALEHQPGAWTTNFTPGGYADAGWQTLNLETDRLRYHRSRAVLPRTAELLDRLPGLASVQVGILEPGCELTEHHGDTNVMFRMHLGLVIPAGLPDVGIAVDGQERGWAEGEVLVFEDAHRHRVWNRSVHRRIILVVDVLKPELLPRARWLCALAGSGIVVQLLVARLPGFSRLPQPIRRVVHLVVACVAWLVVPIQRRLGGRRVVSAAEG